MKWTLYRVLAAAVIFGQLLCGSVQAHAQQRIIGGSQVNISAFPSTVAILANARLNHANPLFTAQNCAGTLITSTWVLTAAHCLIKKGRILRPSEISILAGSTDLIAPVTTRTTVSRVIVHKDYKAVIFGDDIALLQLSEPAPAPAIAMNDAQLDANQSTYIVGWGTTTSIKEDGSGKFPSFLKGAIVPTQRAADCAALPGNYQFVDPSKQICAGYPQGGIDSCNGDSGGPLYSITKEGTLRLAGITSWGKGCAQPNQPGIYTDIVAYKGWIDEMMGPDTPNRNLDDQGRVELVNPNLFGTRSSNSGGGATILIVPVLLLWARYRSTNLKKNQQS